ncbi:MAG: NADH-quinone oxidoreductase subunit NuoF [Spirochaetia bacterium]|jgi:NADH:ubiquinone oxidoreductase subunit F (NADH-binding)/(2Fe-2S) ferredoxin/Pyruvate/2-oxoacid:ferredoxin oxidoreductase delta subunit|nr:NADH-quinone oxidoreductase subunit NuoF [Spirochaetia bacterium]
MAVKNYILVCAGTACESSKADDIYQNLLKEVEAHGLKKDVQVVKTGCFGFCEKGPIVKVLPEGAFYVEVKPENAKEIVEENIIKGRVVKHLLYKGDEIEHKDEFEEEDIQFYQKQYRIVLRNCGFIDPENIEEYVARDGYSALEKCLFEISPEQVIEELKTSGLRGRGGAGFPTWMKWNFSKTVNADQKFIVCNADEGDPGAYMDRSTLEGDPHSILEAMAIAGYTIGASKGVIYIRAEYPLAIRRLEIAMEQAKEYGLLGKNILGSKFDFDIEIRLGAGAFVCGEETALLRSVEGKRGMPTPKPPFPAVEGLWGKPTVINNVETLANIPVILHKGGEWFSKIGTPKSPGTKVFALTGRINNSGLVEVPMGITLREIVYDIGGGIRDNKGFKAVQTGGPSGGVITKENLDTPIDFDTLVSIGTMMGSGGMIVLSEADCIINVTKFYMEFCVDESCGKCSPCRIGTKKLYQYLDKISKGNATREDLKKMEEIGYAMKKAALCGLGQTAANPVLSTLRYFRDEYLEHIDDQKCVAGKCKDLVRYEINPEKCIGCTVCARKCPVNCISGVRKQPHVIDQEKCIKCGECYNSCKFGAISIY